MQLLCNGEVLDLYADTKIQFTHDNPIFAFENVKCERTTQFKLPCTPTNDKVLYLSRIPEYNGRGMRRKYDGVLQMGGIVKNGYLYVSSFDGKDYSAIFVAGEFVGLQRVKDAGKIKDIIAPTITTLWGNPQDAWANRTEPWKCLKYLRQRQNVTLNPSMLVSYIVQQCAAALGVSITLPTSANYLRIIPAQLKQYSERSVVISKPHTPASEVVNELLSYDKLFEPCNISLKQAKAQVVYWQDPEAVLPDEHRANYTATRTIGTIKGLRAKTDVIIYYNVDGTDFAMYTDVQVTPDSDRSVAQIKTVSTSVIPYVATIKWNAEFDTMGNPVPSPDDDNPDDAYIVLAAGTEFALIDKNDIKPGFSYADLQAASVGDTLYAFEYKHDSLDYTTSGQPDYSIEMNVLVEKPLEGEQALLYPNLPDVTLTELLKIIGYLTGKLLTYDSVSGVHFIDLNLEAATQDVSDKVISIKDVKREFNGWGQKNTVLFSSDETVLNSERIILTYDINNDNLKESNDLAKIYASEGSAVGVAVYMRNGFDDIKKDTLCLPMVTESVLCRVGLPGNSALERLCSVSTEVKVSLRLNPLEYEQIKNETILYINGSRYVWTSRNWSDNVAQFTLAKV